MEVIKTVLAGCGALAILSFVGCAGIVGVGSYAVDQVLEEEEARQYSSKSPPSRGSNRSDRNSRIQDDPFSNYDSGATFDESGEQVGGWGESDN